MGTTKKKAKRERGANKTDFIRARPTATPKEISEAAAAEGLTIPVKMVSKVRWVIKQQELLHPTKKPASNKWKAKIEAAKTKRATVNGVGVQLPNGKGHTVEDVEADFKALDDAAAAVLGASIGAAVKKIVRSEVRAEVRRIMRAGVES